MIEDRGHRIDIVDTNIFVSGPGNSYGNGVPDIPFGRLAPKREGANMVELAKEYVDSLIEGGDERD